MAEEEKAQEKPVGVPGLWQSMSNRKKASIVVLVVTFLLATALFINHFSTPRMGLLFRGLPNESAAGVISRLQELGVPYELGVGGQEILVPEDRIDELRISLSSEGSLYGSGVGFELFDQTSLGTTESERRLNFQRALQGELQRTIAQLDGINQARVHLALPEPSVFLRETSEATASVVLLLNPLNQLRKDQVRGIVNLVAGSVENLSPEHVTVIDTQGRIISDLDTQQSFHGELNASATLKQLEIKRVFEKELETRVQGMLERVLGGGSVVAMVTAELDFDAEEVTEIAYGEPVLRSRSWTEEEYEGSGAIPGGETGTDANIPSYPYGVLGQGESTYYRLDELENYEISETLTHSIKAPGEVKNLSASVIYDNSRGTLTQPQMAELEGLVSSALGLSEERGDIFSIASIDFDSTHLEETLLAMDEAARVQQRNMYIRYGLTALGIILAFVLGLMFIKKLIAYFNEQAVLRQTALAQKMQAAAAQREILDIGGEDKEQKQVKGLSEKNPETVVSLLKMWLTEDQR